MTSAAVPWPRALEGTPAVAVIEGAIGRGRLSHGLLLACGDPDCLNSAAMALSDRLLNRGADEGPHYPPDRHPDCHHLRPVGKSRSITAASVRELVGRLNVSPSVSHYKVAVVHDADRMNTSAANILLKTLEEPPADTTLLLLTGRPHALLPTIRSRVLHFRFPGIAFPLSVEGWDAWLEDYRNWLGRLGQGIGAGRPAADSIFTVYGLVARFAAMLDAASALEGEKRKESRPEGLEDDELAAIEAEISVGLRLRMFAAIEEATSSHHRALMREGDQGSSRLLAAATQSLERSAGLLRLNLNESAALEDFLLASQRIWTRR